MSSSKKRGAATRRPPRTTNRPSTRPPTAAARSRPATPALVVSSVPFLARVAGAVAVVSAVLQYVAQFFPLVTDPAGEEVGAAGNVFDFVPQLFVTLALGAAGLLCLLGRLPRFGLAVIGAAGACSIGLLLQRLHVYGSDLLSVDLPVPEGLARAFEYEPATGLHVIVAGHIAAIVGFGLTVLAWSRSWMEDEGGLDRRRPTFAVLGLVVGAVAATGVGLAAADSDLVARGTVAVLERGGLSTVGGILFALALLAGSVIAATLRPRLATVGVYVGLSATLFTYGLANALLIERSHVVRASAGSALLLVGALGLAGLALGAWRTSRVTLVPERSTGRR